MLASIVGALLSVFVATVIIGSFFMWIGAKMAGVQNAGFGKSILAAIATSVITIIISGVFSVVPVMGTVLGFLVGLLLSLFIIKAVYDTSFGKALLTWIFCIVAQIVAVIIVVALGIGTIGILLSRKAATINEDTTSAPVPKVERTSTSLTKHSATEALPSGLLLDNDQITSWLVGSWTLEKTSPWDPFAGKLSDWEVEKDPKRTWVYVDEMYGEHVFFINSFNKIGPCGRVPSGKWRVSGHRLEQATLGGFGDCDSIQRSLQIASWDSSNVLSFLSHDEMEILFDDGPPCYCPRVYYFSRNR